MTNACLPKLTDDEVNVFHPAFKIAGVAALKNLNLDDQIRLEHHYPTATGPVDFAFIRNENNKVILPVEVKRTKPSVRGQGRRQARDYYNNFGTSKETPYYCATNLELTELFRDEPNRPLTHSQQVKLSNSLAGDLKGSKTNANFINNFISILEEMLSISINDEGEYLDSLLNLECELSLSHNDLSKWHKLFLPTAFEYIRASSSKYVNIKKHIKDNNWVNVDKLQNNPEKILQLGAGLNFETIFCEPIPKSSQSEFFNSQILDEAFTAGESSFAGEDITGLVNSILTPVGKGIVETDPELANLLVILAKDALDKPINKNQIICDPGAGSGRLLLAATTMLPSISAKQLLAIEIEPLFAEPLSLRLGLAHAESLSSDNSPKVSISNVSSIAKDEFEKVKLIVMNPPYISGIDSKNVKNTFANKIHTVSGSHSKLNFGQAAFETVFLELIWNLVPDDTVISMVFPAQHLTRRGNEACALRKFLANEFSLTHICLHPRTGLFESVTKQTILLVGVKCGTNKSVKLIEIDTEIANLDLLRLSSGLQKKLERPTRTSTCKLLSLSDLDKDSELGWKNYLGSSNRVSNFISLNFSNLIKIGDAGGKILCRGSMANSGHAKLVAISPSDDEMKETLNIIPKSWKKTALNNSLNLPRVSNKDTLNEVSFLPPDDSYTKGSPNNKILHNIVDSYIPKLKEKARTSKQKINIKSNDEIIKDIKQDQKIKTGNFVLIPRASRTTGQASLLNTNDVIVSTNFLLVSFNTKIEQTLFLAWTLSIFGQIQLELLSSSQEGMRKLEVRPVSDFLYPNLQDIPQSVASILSKQALEDEALDFKSPKIRPLDNTWAKYLFPNEFEKKLNTVFDLLCNLLDERNP